jgi:hypothetical protein
MAKSYLCSTQSEFRKFRINAEEKQAHFYLTGIIITVVI